MIRRSITDLSGLLAGYRLTRDLKPTSFEQLAVSVRLFERWFVEAHAIPFNLSLLSEEVTSAFLFWLVESRGNAPRSCNRKRGDLLTLWRYATRKGLLPAVNPDEIVRFKEPARLPDAWTQDELGRFVDACERFQPPRAVPGWDHRHDKALALVVYDTAYRITACLKLQADNLRADGAIVALAESQKTFCDEEKWLGADTLDAIAATQPARGARLFPWPYRRDAFWRRWKRILKLAGLPATRRDGPQKMRRTSASWLEAYRPGSAQHHLRHKRSGLAEKHYLDPRIAFAYKAPELMPRIRT